MIRRSPEIEAIVLRWNEAIRTRDGDMLTNLLSRSEYLRYVGTDENELWHGAVLRAGIAAHFAEVPDLTYESSTVEAYEKDGVGWALWHGHIRFASTGDTSQHRISFVLTMDAGAWKIVQMHISNPRANIEKMGIEHQALDKLVAAAKTEGAALPNEGLATVMFTDIANSTAIASLLGDRVWLPMIDAHLTAVRDAVEGAGGTLVKSLGDGTMSVFPSAKAALDVAVQLQRAAAEAPAEPPLRIRIGLHTGDVIQSRNDFFGGVVNKAARIAGLAEPDEIRLSDATHLMVGNSARFAFSNAVSVPLKGLEGEHTVLLLDWRAN